MQTRPHLRLLKLHVQFAKWLQPSELQASLLWAALVGCIGGFSAILFRQCIQGVLWLFTRNVGSLEQVAAELAWWQRFAIPAVGGFLAGLVLRFGERLGRGHRSTDYMEAVALRKGALSVRQSTTKTLSSLLTIGSGGSIGREGAMVQLSATLASWLGLSWRLSTPKLLLLVACGAAAGLAAVYNVTIAAALFVAEVVLGSISMESLGPLLVAAVGSSMVSRYLGGVEAYFGSPPFALASPAEIVPYLLMAIALGLASLGFVLLLHKTENWLTALVPQVYLRMALGGLIEEH